MKNALLMWVATAAMSALAGINGARAGCHGPTLALLIALFGPAYMLASFSFGWFTNRGPLKRWLPSFVNVYLGREP